MDTNTEELHQLIGKLFSDSLEVSTPIYMLHTIREKLQACGHQPFYKQDILQELGRLQAIAGQLHKDMLLIDSQLKKM